MQIPTINLADTIKKKFIGADDLRRDLSDILENMPREDSQLIITQHGKPKAILLDLNTYLQLVDIQEDVIQPGYIDTLYKELDAVKKGKGISHEELMKQLKLDA
jgi:prevent-host-death family protein